MRTYDWNGNVGLEMSFPDRSDYQAATRVRMLMRDDLDHESVCTMARDRIMALSKEKAKLMQELGRVRSAILSVENCTATAAFVTTQTDLIDAALRGTEKP